VADLNFPDWLSQIVDVEALEGATSASFGAEAFRGEPPGVDTVGPLEVSRYRTESDAEDVRRLRLSWDGGSIDLLPTKGLSIGAYVHGSWKPFWEPVVPGLISPDREDLLGPMLVNGARMESMRWLENFAGCVELLGFSNWGMPRKEDEGGVTLPLHGEASHIPVSSLEITVCAVGGAAGAGSVESASLPIAVIHGRVPVPEAWWREPDTSRPWYERGRSQWRLDRRLVLSLESPRLVMVDEVKNVGDASRHLDWGYHYQFRAENGARLLIPSESVEGRFEPEVPGGFERWTPSPDAADSAADSGAPGATSKRYERGYIHKGLDIETSPIGTPVVRGLASYPSASSTCFVMPAATYTLSWFSCGGAGSLEFAFPERPNESALPVSWDGMGPEIGSSALDDDGNVDPGISHPPVAPGESIRLYSELSPCAAGEAGRRATGVGRAPRWLHNRARVYPRRAALNPPPAPAGPSPGVVQ
jgi:hypothetical protein